MNTGHSVHQGRSRPPGALAYAAACGAGAGLAANAALLIAGALEGRPLPQPFNATSHWLWGQQAGQVRSASARYTGTGAATNMAASLFWGAVFGAHLASRPDHGTAEILRDAAVMGAVATAVDYGLVPKRLTPGWELALPKRSVALTMGAMALGLAAGAIALRGALRR